MMERKIIIGLVLFVEVLGVFSGVSVSDVIKGVDRNIVSGEEPTDNTVIWIYNVYDLQNMSKNLAGHYALANDINASATKTWNGGNGFVPIGSLTSSFSGVFDGKGHKITNLYINRPTRYGVGLFGCTSLGSTVENVGLVNVTVRGRFDVGGLVGRNDGVVNNSYVSGNVSGANTVGGLVGYNIGTVRNSYATCNVSGGFRVGGLVGDNYNVGTVRNSHYDIDKVVINGGHHLTIGGLFDHQYNDWLSHGLHLNISDYSSTLIPAGGYYLINSVQGLKDLLGFADMNYKFRLAANLSLSSEPGLCIPYFAGEFDGNNHTISNLKINMSFASKVGLIGHNKGTVKNVGVVDVDVSGGNEVGGLVGYNLETVNNCYATGDVSGSYQVGGLVGYNDHQGGVSNCYVTGNVSGGGDYVGGLVGVNEGTVSISHVAGNVSGANNIGGLVGYNIGTVRNSYATGNVSGSYQVGGFVGLSVAGGVRYTYATARVTGISHVGGLIGYNNGGTTIASFWDINTTGQTTSAGGTGKTTDEMMNKTTFTSAGWDFTNIWNIWDGRTYPFFKWEDVKAVPLEPLNLRARLGDRYVNFTWEAPADNGGLPIIKYRIYRGVSSGKE
ncbi:MAG: hypothetical protein DRN35_01985, partial [Thermoplasmata archaeon]